MTIVDEKCRSSPPSGPSCVDGGTLSARGTKMSSVFSIWLRPLIPTFVCVVFIGTVYGSFHEQPVSASGDRSILLALGKWTPLLAEGFALNLAISFLAMSLGTILGTALGVARVSTIVMLRRGSWLLVQVFRNSPGLVLLFFSMFMFPFSFKVFGIQVPFPDWVKAIVGLSIAVMAYVAEIIRGAIQSIPVTQWEAGESLGFTRAQLFRLVILPLALRRVLPPWMNMYALLIMATPLASILGVKEIITYTGMALAAEERHDLLIPMYLYVLGWFFAYAYPISKWTAMLERKLAIRGW